MKEQLDIKLQQKLQELKSCYEKGELDAEEIHDLLDIEIMVELAKPAEEINSAWVDACAGLMAYADKEQLATSDAHKKLVQPLRGISSKPRRWHMPTFQLPGQWALTTFCKLGIGVFSCLLLVGSVLRWSWLYSSQSDDGQKYYIQGEQFEVMEGGEACADDPNLQVEECVTQDFNELCEFLGFTPAMPTWAPEGWEITEYYGCYTGRSYDYEVIYEKPGVKHVLGYYFSYMATPEHVAVTFFQNGEGYYRRLANGKEVYLYTNAGDKGAVWYTDCTIENVGGPISEEDIIWIVESIQKVEE